MLEIAYRSPVSQVGGRIVIQDRLDAVRLSDIIHFEAYSILHLTTRCSGFDSTVYNPDYSAKSSFRSFFHGQ